MRSSDAFKRLAEAGGTFSDKARRPGFEPYPLAFRPHPVN
jgi:hypothetical protein